MAFASTPNIMAGDTIRPYRFVRIVNTEDNLGMEANAGDIMAGVAAGDTKQHDSANHAEDGDQIALQMGAVVLCEAGGAITRSAMVESDEEGRAVAETTSGTSNRVVAGIALESAGGAGEIIRVLWRPGFRRHALS
jgi:hypothetical protein